MYSKMQEVPLVNDYYLPDWFSVVIPEATENLVTNPSVEIDTTGYTLVGAGVTIARTIDDQRRGSFALQINPANAVASGVYFGTITLTAGEAYNFSLDVHGVAGHVYNVYFADNAGARIGSSQEFTATGYWQRINISYSEDAALAHRFYIVQDASDTEVFYIDGLQVEQKAYPTTYCDGDLEGFVIGEVAYYWDGTFHGSTSFRAATTRSGGKIVNLKEYGFNLLGAVGLGLAPVSNFSLPSNLGGAFYQNTISNARNFSILGDMNFKEYYLMTSAKAALENALAHNLTIYRQPLLLHFQETDPGDCTRPVGEEVFIKCLYQTGLEGNFDNLNAENFPLQFTAFDRESIWADGDKAIEIGFNEFYESGNFIKHSGDTWDNLNANADGIIYTIEVDEVTGDIYVGGDFANIGGVAAVRIARYRNGAWSAIGVGVDGEVRVLKLSGTSMYIGGDFATAGGVVCRSFSHLDISTDIYTNIGDLDAGGGFDRWVHDILITETHVYITGQFTIAGAANAVNVARFIPGGAWSSLDDGGGNDGVGVAGNFTGGLALASIDGENIYVGGYFTTVATGTVAALSIAMWTTDSTWSTVGGGVDSTGPGAARVTDFDWDPQNNLIVGGYFNSVDGTIITGVLARYLGLWTGSTWIPKFSEIYVEALTYDKNTGLVLIVGTLDIGFMFTASLAEMYSSVNLSISTNDVDFYDIRALSDNYSGGILYAIEIDKTGSILLGGDTEGAIIPHTNTISEQFISHQKFVVGNNSGVYSSYPKTIKSKDYNVALSFHYAIPANGISEISENGLWQIIGGADRSKYLHPNDLFLDEDNDLHAIKYTFFFETNDGAGQLGAWALVFGLTLDNTNGGIIYANIVDLGGGFRRVDLFEDAARLNIIAHTANYNATGLQALIEDNNSGISGHIYISVVGAADIDIFVTYELLYSRFLYRKQLKSIYEARYS